MPLIEVCIAVLAVVARRPPVRRRLPLSVLGAGRNQMNIAMQSVIFGGNVLVGLEDSL